MQNYYLGIVMQLVFGAMVVYFLGRLAKKRVGEMPKNLMGIAALLIALYIGYIAVTGVGQFMATSFGRLAVENQKIAVLTEDNKEIIIEGGENSPIKYEKPIAPFGYKGSEYEQIPGKEIYTLKFYEKDKEVMDARVFLVDDSVTRHEGDKIIPISSNTDQRVLAAEVDGRLYAIKVGNMVVVPDPMWMESILTQIK
ncbi:MAG: hypothetical protein GXZ11_06125 [Tissierellia bacterium]|nr:hypothetical protein [Tissierellia bacterium]